jgi:opacity protein-like surface antigen
MRMRVLAAMTVASIAGGSEFAEAQQIPRFELFAGYGNLINQRVTNSDVATVNGLTPSQVRSVIGADVTNASGRAGLNGFSASATRFFNERLGLSGEMSANGKTESPAFFGLPGTDRTRVYQFLAGPHVAFRTTTRAAPFVRALFGAARFSGTYSNPAATITDKQTSFAMAVGGGVDVGVNRHLSIRAVQIDYNPILLRRRILRDSTGVPFELKGVRRDDVRLSFGVVVR